MCGLARLGARHVRTEALAYSISGMVVGSWTWAETVVAADDLPNNPLWV
jgi:hypothetical protein